MTNRYQGGRNDDRKPAEKQNLAGEPAGMDRQDEARATGGQVAGSNTAMPTPVDGPLVQELVFGGRQVEPELEQTRVILRRIRDAVPGVNLEGFTADDGGRLQGFAISAVTPLSEPAGAIELNTFVVTLDEAPDQRILLALDHPMGLEAVEALVRTVVGSPYGPETPPDGAAEGELVTSDATLIDPLFGAVSSQRQRMDVSAQIAQYNEQIERFNASGAEVDGQPVSVEPINPVGDGVEGRAVRYALENAEVPGPGELLFPAESPIGVPEDFATLAYLYAIKRDAQDEGLELHAWGIDAHGRTFATLVEPPTMDDPGASWQLTVTRHPFQPLLEIPGAIAELMVSAVNADRGTEPPSPDAVTMLEGSFGVAELRMTRFPYPAIAEPGVAEPTTE